MTADFITNPPGIKGYLEFNGLVVPDLSASRRDDPDYVFGIGKLVANPVVQRAVLDGVSGARIDQGEAMVMWPYPYFLHVARELVGQAGRESISLQLPGNIAQS